MAHTLRVNHFTIFSCRHDAAMTGSVFTSFIVNNYGYVRSCRFIKVKQVYKRKHTQIAIYFFQAEFLCRNVLFTLALSVTTC